MYKRQGLLITYAATANQSGGISSNDLQAQIEAYNNAIEATKQDLTETPDAVSYTHLKLWMTKPFTLV